MTANMNTFNPENRAENGADEAIENITEAFRNYGLPEEIAHALGETMKTWSTQGVDEVSVNFREYGFLLKDGGYPLNPKTEILDDRYAALAGWVESNGLLPAVCPI